MKLIFKKPTSLSFKDVPINRFYTDYQGDLMLKMNEGEAVRIATRNGDINSHVFKPCKDFAVDLIYPINQIEF